MKPPAWLSIERNPDADTPGYVAYTVTLAECDACGHPLRFHAKGTCHFPFTDDPDSAPCGPCNGEQP